MFFQRYKFTSYTERRAKRFRIFRTAFIIFLIFILYQLISSYIIAAYRIQADTMQPTFSSGDMIITTPFYSPQKDIERGTLVTVEPIERPHQNFFEKMVQKIIAFFTFQLVNPFSANQPSQAKPFVRRVVGIPGDTLYMEDFVLHIKTKDGEHFLTEFEVTKNDYKRKPTGELGYVTAILGLLSRNYAQRGGIFCTLRQSNCIKRFTPLGAITSDNTD